MSEGKKENESYEEEGEVVLVENPYHTARLKPKRKGKRPPKLIAVVHQSGCTGCEVCIAGCPVDSIELVQGPNPLNPAYQQMVEIDINRCIGCQNCSIDCPWETITMYGHEDAFVATAEETLKSELYIPEDSLKDWEDKMKAPQSLPEKESTEES